MNKNKKYNDIIHASQGLFYKYGIKKVTIEDVCKEANVSKMTFYKHFPNKKELEKTVIDKVFGAYFKQFADLIDSDIAFPEKMKKLLQMKIEGIKDANWDFVVDLYKSPDSEMVTHVHTWIQKGLDMTLAYFSDAQQKGWMRKDLNPTLLLVILDKMQEMALDERVINTYSDLQEMATELTKFFLYGIFDER